MGLINFLIVVAFNIWWMRDGMENYKNLYTGKIRKWLSVFVWVYAVWGVANLISFIIKNLPN